jgi:hypothetical protein
VLIILGEEIAGTHPTPQLPIVLMLNLPWLLFPIAVMYRVGRTLHPFSEAVTSAASASVPVMVAVDTPWEARFNVQENP